LENPLDHEKLGYARFGLGEGGYTGHGAGASVGIGSKFKFKDSTFKEEGHGGFVVHGLMASWR
jgi:hypothetical protein